MINKIKGILSNFFVLNIEAINLVEYFLISSVVSLLGIRAYLALTNYPQVGGNGFHIAHMLWGGLFMAIAVLISLVLLDSKNRVVTAVLGGIGFGTFIDELGKFITSDNNYFYQPTIAIIYVLFISIYLFLRFLHLKTTYSKKTYIANLAEIFKEFVISDFDENEKQKALTYIKNIGASDNIIQKIYELVSKAKTKKAKSSLYWKAKSYLPKVFSKLAQIKIIKRLLLLYFILNCVGGLIIGIIDLLESGNTQFGVLNYGYILSLLVVGFYAIKAIKQFKKSSLKMYLNLHKATLVSIFISQFFLFIENQLAALSTLFFLVIVYQVINYSLALEKNK